MEGRTAQYNWPTVLIFTRQNLPILDRSEYPSAEGLQRCGYVLLGEQRERCLPAGH